MPTLDREPPFRQIAAHYRALIETGKLPPGNELPAVRALAELWQVSPGTAARALTALREEGWIVARRGKPAVVRRP